MNSVVMLLMVMLPVSTESLILWTVLSIVLTVLMAIHSCAVPMSLLEKQLLTVTDMKTLFQTAMPSSML